MNKTRPIVADESRRFAAVKTCVDAHAKRLDQTAIGWHVVARRQQHHIARHQFGQRQLHRAPVAQRGGVLRQQIAQRGQR